MPAAPKTDSTVPTISKAARRRSSASLRLACNDMLFIQTNWNLLLRPMHSYLQITDDFRLFCNF